MEELEQDGHVTSMCVLRRHAVGRNESMEVDEVLRVPLEEFLLTDDFYLVGFMRLDEELK
jgi:hypothetical protein